EPRYAYAYLKLAQIALQQSQEERALELIQESGAQTSEDASVLLLSGALYRLLGRYDDAKGQHQRLVDLQPDNVSGWSELGRDHLVAFEHESAVDAFTRATELDPASKQAWSGLSIARLHLASDLADADDFDEARRELQLVLELDVHPAIAHANLALVALRMGDGGEARRAIDAARQIDPEGPGVARVEARVLVAEKKFEAAIERFDAVIAV